MGLRSIFGMGKIDLVRALVVAARPLSLSLAFYSTTLGISLAFRNGALFAGPSPFIDLILAALVTVAGLAAQTATNFINDYFECGQKHVKPAGRTFRFLGRERNSFDILVFFLGLASFGLMCLIGLWFVIFRDHRLIWIGLAGLAGGYSYTGEPVVYKRFGLGAILSFVLLGPLMTFGSYLALTGIPDAAAVWLPLPVSLLIPLLMLSNELRDHERDKNLGIRTLTVRIGFGRGKALYLGLIVLSFALPILYSALGLIHPLALATILALPFAVKSFRTVKDPRGNGVPPTNLLHLAFGALYIAALALRP